MSNTALVDRVRIFDRAGIEIAAFVTDVERSWAIGLEGRASFTYATRKTNIVDEDIFRFGNYLLVENTRLPDWIGVIDTPRQWASRTVTVNAYTPERLFKYRRGPLEQKLTGSAGSIFRQMINLINSSEKTILQQGNIWDGGSQREETLNPNQISDNLASLQKRSLEEYQFSAAILNSRLNIYGNWFHRLGTDTPLTLIETKGGGNIENPSMKEDGEIINDILGYGDGQSWKSRPNSTTTDLSSIWKYGLRQDGVNYNGVKQIPTINQNNADFLTKNKDPRKIFELTALNVGNTFDFLDLGNQVQVVLQNMGFVNGGIGTSTTTRILGMSYNNRQGQKVKLVLDEVPS